MTLAHALIVGLPTAERDNPSLWHVRDGIVIASGSLADIPEILDGADIADTVVMAIVPPAQARCIWSSFPNLEPRQAAGVARLHAVEQSIGPVHAVSRHLGADIVVTATIAPVTMDYGLLGLARAGLNPDIIIPAGLTIDAPVDGAIRATIDGAPVLRGVNIAAPDETALRTLLIGDAEVKEIDNEAALIMLVAAAQYPMLNLREGIYAKREQRVWATAEQRKWIIRLFAALIAATLLLALTSWAKYRLSTDAEDDRALAAAQKIDPAITDIAQAEAQIDRAFQQKGLSSGRFGSLSAGLWRAVKSTPNVSVRELRYGDDGIMSAVLAAPDATGINNALLAIQRDGFRITATPRQDTSGATLVDLTMRMP